MPPQEVQLNLSEKCSLEAWADKLQAWGWQWSPAGGSCVRLTHHAEVLGTALGATDFQVRVLLLFSRHEQRTFSAAVKHMLAQPLISDALHVALC